MHAKVGGIVANNKYRARNTRIIIEERNSTLRHFGKKENLFKKSNIVLLLNGRMLSLLHDVDGSEWVTYGNFIVNAPKSTIR